jgi:hypothetical protein
MITLDNNMRSWQGDSRREQKMILNTGPVEIGTANLVLDNGQRVTVYQDGTISVEAPTGNLADGEYAYRYRIELPHYADYPAEGNTSALTVEWVY